MRLSSALLPLAGLAGFTGALTLGAFPLVSGACGGSTFTTAGPGADQACTDSAQAVCTKMQSCAPLDVQTAYGDVATCQARIKATCLNTLSAPSTGATPGHTESCAQAYAGYACADYLDKTRIPAACQQVTGSLPAGGACEVAGQCQSGFCAIAPGSACGKCASAPQAGDSCAQLTTCGQALTCTTDTLVCTAYAAESGPCGAGQPCGAGLSCVAPGGAGTAGTCQAAGAQVGAACDGSAKTAPSCDGALGLYCDGKTKACAQTMFAAGGQPCGYSPDAGTLVQCAAGSCQGGQCVARAADNGPCVVADGGASATSAGCVPSARCVAASGGSGTCQVVAATSCP